MEKDKYGPQKRYRQKNISTLRVDCQNEFAEAFRKACKELNVTVSHVFKEAMKETIEKARLNK